MFARFETHTLTVTSSAHRYVVVTGKENIAVLPNSVKLDDAAAIGCVGATSYQCIEPFVKPGSKVLINGGSGGTGTFGIQIAKVLGCNVTATCSGPKWVNWRADCAAKGTSCGNGSALVETC